MDCESIVTFGLPSGSVYMCRADRLWVPWSNVMKHRGTLMGLKGEICDGAKAKEGGTGGNT